MATRSSLTPVYTHLKAERMRAGKTQREMAEALGIAREAYTLIESGDRHLRAEEARAAAEFLKIPIARLFRKTSDGDHNRGPAVNRAA